MKRLLAFACALVLVFSYAITASAAPGAAPMMTVGSASGAPGETVEVAVELGNNPGISSAVLEIDFDDTRLTLLSAAIGEKFNTGAYANINLPYVTFVRSDDVAENTVLLTLIFEIKEDAEMGDAYVTILYEEGDITNYDEEDVNFEVMPGIISVECGHAAKTAVPAKNADCEHEGNRLYYVCDSCGVVLKADGVTETTVAAETIVALGHAWGNWVVIQKPTASVEGVEERICTRCGHAEQRTVAKLENPFNDVAPGSFYYEPVMWAVENGITNGTSATTFGPNDQCMRAHVVTFLWRAVGCPEPTKTDNPFVDVKPGDFYYKPVLWAVENGITSGMDATHFGPTAYCNRAQVVTFLYRTMGSPEVDATRNPFVDVPTGQWFTAPVLWAVENGITNGLSSTAFGPNSICNRAQIVTFLYRAFVND